MTPCFFYEYYNTKNKTKLEKEELLDEFLKERVKQKLIFSIHKKKFSHFENETHSKKILGGHIKSLCEKCQSFPTGYCGDAINTK